MKRAPLVIALAGCGRIGFGVATDGAPDGAATSDVRVGDVGADGTSAVALEQEAELGTLVASFTTVADATASGGMYVIDGNPPGMSGPGRVSFAFELPRTGIWYVWVHVRVPDNSRDSFGLSIDSASPVPFFIGDCIYDNAWRWTPYRAPATCPMLGLRGASSLPAGPVTYHVSSREGQAVIDKFLITDDGSYVPPP